jgi:pimeloyl-ACP methyl ester carboxylesterase
MKIASNGIHLHVADQGNGTPAIVFLHYWGGSSRTWNNVIAALPKAYRTVAPDHRGWGDSDAPASGYALADFADDAQGVIDSLRLDQFVLVGHSMGGKIAQLLASRRPKGLTGLVMVAPSPPVPLVLPAEVRAQMESAYTSRASVEAAIDHMLTAKPLSAAHREQVIEDSLRGAPQAKAAWPLYASLEDITREVAAIDVPAIVIAGELDRVDSVETLRSQLLPHIPHARMQVVPGSGHLSPLEAPVEVAGFIQEFVESLAHP